MRKIPYFFLIVVFTFMLPGSLHANVSGTALKDFPRQSLLYESLRVNNMNLLGEIFLLPDESFDHIEVANIITRVDRLPDRMLRKMINNGIQIVLFDGSLTDNPSAQGLRGITPRGYDSGKTWDDVPGVGGSKLVLVKIGSSHTGEGHSSINLELHELAHSLDRQVYDLIREDLQFLKIWKKESNAIFFGRGYFLQYPEEYFAETFALYYLGGEYRDLLRGVAPETYRFIERLE